MTSPCPACGAAIPAASRFCPACGAGLARARRANEIAAARRLAQSTSILVLGSLAVLAGGALVPVSESTGALLAYPLLALVGAASGARLGPGALRASLAGASGARGIGLGLAAGALGFLASWGFVALLRSASGSEPEAPAGPLPLLAVEVVLLPALVEEWLCRGVLWVVLRRALSARWTVLVSAALFALLHGLGGGGYWEYPHRFLLGLILGLLRWRTGSLVPGVIAHAVNNALALSVP